MKTVNYIMVAVAVTLGFSSCYDLDVAPLLRMYRVCQLTTR